MESKHTTGPWEWRQGILTAGDHECVLGEHSERGAEANARLISASPIGYELAEAIINQATDGMDRSEWILRKAEEFMAKVEGQEEEHDD